MKMINWITLAIAVVALVFGILVFISVKSIERNVDYVQYQVGDLEYEVYGYFGFPRSSRIDNLEYEVDRLGR